MLRAGSVNVGSHLASPVLPEARGGILLHASLPPIPSSRSLCLSWIVEISLPNNQPIFCPPKHAQHLQARRMLMGMARARFALQHPYSCLPIHPSSWPLSGGVSVGPRSARQRLSLFPGFGCALAPVSPPRSLSSKASQLVKLLLCAPLM